MNFEGLLAPGYSLWSTKAECDLSINVWREKIESGQGVNPYYLRRSPGILPQISPAETEIAPAIGGPVRGMFDASVNGEERLWWATTRFYESADGANITTDFGPISDDGKFVQFAASQNTLMFVSAGVLYRVNGGGLAAVALTFTPIGIVFLKNLFVALSSSLQQFYWSEDDGATFPAGNVQTAEADANDVLGIQTKGQQLWLIGNRITQVYSVGTNPDAPFVPLDGTVIRSGTISAATVRLLGESFLWLERTAEDQGSVVMTDGYSVRRVSNFYIDNAIQVLSKTVDLSTATALSFGLAGHSFYRLTIGDKTFEYHQTQDEWEEVAWWDWLAGQYHKHRGFSACQAFGKTLIGDHTNGLIYELSADTYHDYGFPIRWNRRAPHIIQEGKRVEIKRLELPMETGVGLDPPLWLNNYSLDAATFAAAVSTAFIAGDITFDQAVTLQSIYDFEPYIPLDPYPSPQIMNDFGFFPWGGTSALDDGTIIGTPPQIVMRYSRDGGRTYTNEQPKSMGAAGDYDRQVYWNRLGRARDFVIDLFSTEPTKLAIIQGVIEAEELAS